jgi:phage terminase large subunit
MQTNLPASQKKTTAQQALEASRNLVLRWRDDPVRFAYEGLKVRKLSPDQVNLLESVAAHDRVACKSGQKTGKSSACAILALWWPLTRYRGLCVITAPSFQQVKDPLWKEVHRLYWEAKQQGNDLGGHLYQDPSSGWVLPGDSKLFCRTTDQAERLQGFSSPNMLIIVDEASGYPSDLWDPLIGNLSGCGPGAGKLFAPSNPTQTSGVFFDAFNSKAEFWHRITLSSENTPNYLRRKVVIPGLATYEQTEQKRREWGEESAAYQVRVLGNFPTQSDNAVIPLRLVNEAVARYDTTPPTGQLNIGVDVARFGDDETVICCRRGNRIIEWKFLQGSDNVDVAGEVLKMARRLTTGILDVARIKVDTCGLGSGVYDILSRETDIEAVSVNVAESATVEGYYRLRDQLWFAIRDWLAGGGAFADDARLLSELVAPEYGFDTQNRTKVESKDDTKRKLKRSPDRADALALSIFEASYVGDFYVGGCRSIRA